jgi:tRNA threonylcarbamoyladenosine biosynthesis protein TsaB
VRYRAALETAGIEVPDDDSPLHLVRAVAVCELGVEAEVRPVEAVLPDYVRRPDAELALQESGGAGVAR